MKAFFIGINSKYIHTALGVRSVAEYCRRQGIAACVLESSVNEPVLSVLMRVTEAVEASRAGQDEILLIGMDVHIWNRKFVLELGELLRKVLPDGLFVLGGPEVMFRPEEIFQAAPFADYIVCGEGEVVVAEFLHSLARYELSDTDRRKRFFPPEKVIPQGIAYRDESGGTVKPEEPVVVKNLDILPFPYPDIESVGKQRKIVYYEASRGCPFHCSYCLSGISHSVRRRSLPLVLADMERFIRSGVSLVKFVDRTYNLDEAYYLPLMQYLAEADTEITFHFEIKADILSPRAIAFLKTVPRGRFQLEIGVQSTNPEVLHEIGRRDNWDRLEENVTALIQAGNMHIHMDLIAGLPPEDLNSFRRSFDDVYRLQPHALQLGFLKILPGTAMERSAPRHGMVYMEQPPYEILSNNYISYREIRFLKTLEEVFDLTYNSGRFPFVLAFLVKQAGKGSAYAFYTELTEWYSSKGLQGLGHNGMETGKMLFDYTAERHPSVLAAVRELLRLDVMRSLPNFKPEWLLWRTAINYDKATSFWRNESVVRKYIPGYSFENWRSLHKKYALEEFLFDPWKNAAEPVFILVNYAEMNLTRIETDAII